MLFACFLVLTGTRNKTLYHLQNGKYLLKICKHPKKHIDKSCFCDIMAPKYNKKGFVMYIKRKPENWLSPDELGLYIVYTKQSFDDLLKRYQTYMPNVIRTWLVDGELHLCLHKSFLDEFCKIAKLLKHEKPLNPERYIFDVNVLAKYYINSTPEHIAYTLAKLYKSRLPGAKKAITFRSPSYYVFADSIDWLLGNSNLNLKDNIGGPLTKHSGLTPNALQKYIQEDESVIAKKLSSLQKNMRDMIYTIYDRKEGITLALDPKALEKFVAAAGLTFKPDYYGIEANIIEPFYVKETVKQMLRLLEEKNIKR